MNIKSVQKGVICYNHRHLMASKLAYVCLLTGVILACSICVGAIDHEKSLALPLGENARIPFSAQFSDSRPPVYTISFQSKRVPFCSNDEIEPYGLMHEDQESRFSSSFSVIGKTASVNLTITDVRAHDKGIYVFQYGVTIVYYNISVHIPPGKPNCSIQVSGYRDGVHEIQCSASSGNGLATITCFQDGEKMLYKDGIVRDGNSMRKVFWLLSVDTPFVCCSHDINQDVSETSCTSACFRWTPPAIDSQTSTSSPDPSPPSRGHLHFVHYPTLLMMTILACLAFKII